jgi:DNA-binding NarL/FixJ family response regulator
MGISRLRDFWRASKNLMIRIIIADDHDIVRQGLNQIVAGVPDMVVCGEAETAEEALGLVRTKPCDVLVLDITLPGKSGLEILKDLKQIRPDLPVLILSIHSEDEYAVRVLKAGAAGYMTKRAVAKDLITAIRKVVEGGKYISPAVAEKLAFSLSADVTKPPHETLSDREYQVMLMIAKGYSLAGIADELALSEKTISTYRARILEKMHMQKNAEIIRYALQNKLVD